MKRAVFASPLRQAALLLLISFTGATAQDRPGPDASKVVERGRFRLHNVLQPTGWETYEITREGESLILTSVFEDADRGTKNSLSTRLEMRRDLTPVGFESKGKPDRDTHVDISVRIKDGVASVREGSEIKQATPPGRFFTVGRFAPVSVQMLLVRYWASRGGRGPLKVLPDGEVTIERRGRDVVRVGGRRVALDRYSVGGIIWGRETLWFDAAGQMVAIITQGNNQFEAVREGYGEALPFFVSRAVGDGMEAFARFAKNVSPGRGGTLAIVGATLIDGTGRPPTPDSAIIIRGGRITAAGPRSRLRIPKGAATIDARGRTVLPGLWDMHAHFNQVEWGPLYLAAGVTTVRDCGNEFEVIKTLRDALRAGRGLGPRILTAGFLEGDSPDAIGVMRARTPEEAREQVRRYKSAGFDQIKIYNFVKPEIVRVISDEAHRLGLTVTGHVPRGMNALQAVEAGLDQINHVRFIYDAMLPKGVKRVPGKPSPVVDLKSADAGRAIEFLKAHRTVVDPTLAIYELDLHSADVPVAAFEPGVVKVAPELRGPLNSTGVPPAEAADAQKRFAQYVAIVGALHRAGIPIVAGSDMAVPGHSLHRELELYVGAGLTPMEAIQAATIVPARAMGLDKDSGTVEAGKVADLIIVEGDPLRSISDVRKVRTVVTGGRVYDCGRLWRSVGFQE